jgi:hypothetical protein
VHICQAFFTINLGTPHKQPGKTPVLGSSRVDAAVDKDAEITKLLWNFMEVVDRDDVTAFEIERSLV